MRRQLGRIGRGGGAGVSMLLLALATAPEARAQHQVLFTPDVTATLGTVGPSTVTGRQVASDDGAGTVTPALAGMTSLIPANARIAGFELSSEAPPLLTLDITASLPGLPTPAEPRDVVAFDATSSSFSFAFVGAANGVPPGARIDAVSRDPAGDILLSFDVTLDLPGVGAVDDEDLVSFAGGSFSMVFDGSANGIAPGLDLDAASRVEEASSDLLLSFDGSGTVGGVAFDDEDTLRFHPGPGTWEMYADASQSDPTHWPAVDLVALPEPGFASSLGAGALLLALLRRRRAP